MSEETKCKSENFYGIAREAFFRRATNDYIDESGMPIHLPIPVTENGEGPEDDEKADHWICWCNTDCSWNRALKYNLEKEVHHE